MARWTKTYCSQCGGEFGPGDHGFSHCQDHEGLENYDDEEWEQRIYYPKDGLTRGIVIDPEDDGRPWRPRSVK